MSYVGTSSEGFSDQEHECPKTPLRRYLFPYSGLFVDMKISLKNLKMSLCMAKLVAKRLKVSSTGNRRRL